MAPHFDQILGDPESSFYLAGAPKVHMVVGEDYREYVRHFRDGTTKPYQEHSETFMHEVAEALKTLPRIFLNFVLPQLPGLYYRSYLVSAVCLGTAAGYWMSAAAVAGQSCRSRSGSPRPTV
jgi:hypothetical protein